MSKKTTEVVTKTYGSSWISSIVIAFIVGLVGWLIAPTAQGFIVGFVMSLLCELMVLASMIPFVGIYFQWVWTLQISHWLIGLGGFTEAQYGMFSNILLYFPLIFAMIFGVIVFAVITGVVVVLIGALIFH